MTLSEPCEKLLYLSRADVAAVNLPMAEVIAAVEEAFRHKGEGQTEMPPKSAIHPHKDSFIHAMPAYIKGMEAAGIKWVSGYPGNQKRNLPYVAGLFILNDSDTGLPLAVMDCSWITSERTGAATAVAAKYLARPDASNVGILGCGIQGRSNLRALCEVLPIRTVLAYDTDRRTAETYAAQMSEQTDVDVRIVQSARSAVEEMDVVVTAGPILLEPHGTIQPDWLAEGVFLSPVDFDSYFCRAALNQASLYCTDDKAQYDRFQQMGYFKDTPPIHADLGELVSGAKPGRQSAAERTICLNLGVAISDVAVAAVIYQRAVREGIGVRLLP